MFNNLFKKLTSTFLMLSFILVFPSVANAENVKIAAKLSGQVVKAQELTVPGGLSIPVSFSFPVDSKSVRTGDSVPVVISNDVYVNGTLLFKKGSTGSAFIENAKPARMAGRAGIIEIRSGKLIDVYGNEFNVNLGAMSQGNSSKSAMILPIVAAVILWPLIFFIFKKGDETTIPAGKMYNAFTTAPQTIKVQ